jgi:hypothetical protein
VKVHLPGTEIGGSVIYSFENRSLEGELRDAIREFPGIAARGDELDIR